LENVISIYIDHNRTVDYNPAFIHLCGPFVYSFDNEYDVYYSFERLMILLGTNIHKYIKFKFILIILL